MSIKKQERNDSTNCYCCKKEFKINSLKTFYYAVGYYALSYLPGLKLATYRTKETVEFLGKDTASYCPKCLDKLKRFYNTELFKRLKKLYLSASLGCILFIPGALNHKLQWIGSIGSFILLFFMVLIIAVIMHLIRQKHAVIYPIMKNQEVYKNKLSENLKETDSIKIALAFKNGSKLYTIESKDYYESFDITYTRVADWNIFPKYIEWDKFETQLSSELSHSS